MRPFIAMTRSAGSRRCRGGVAATAGVPSSPVLVNAAVAREDRRHRHVAVSRSAAFGGPYRRLCAAVAVSETGDWLLFIALPLYVLGASGSALDTSTVFLAELIPAVVVGIVGAPLIDRWNPSRLLATLTGLQALVVLPLLWAGHGTCG